MHTQNVSFLNKTGECFAFTYKYRICIFCIVFVRPPTPPFLALGSVIPIRVGIQGEALGLHFSS